MGKIVVVRFLFCRVYVPITVFLIHFCTDVLVYGEIYM